MTTGVETLLTWLDELVEAAADNDPPSAPELQIRKSVLRYLILQRTTEPTAQRLLRQADERRSKAEKRMREGDGRSRRPWLASHFTSEPLLERRAWKATFLNSEGTELESQLTDAPLEAVIADVRAGVGKDFQGLICSHVLIFGDPESAPPDFKHLFLPNPSHWVPGFHLRVGPA